ncbi:histone H2A.1 [Tanacetum coccineum]|uniref:Histone H2A n=1 Tax=Tanacetum coccineum TaxID=301880 RepID=A0ABQ4ZLE8_9ASTR
MVHFANVSNFKQQNHRDTTTTKTSPTLQPLNATNSRQIIDINYRRPPLFALTNSPSLMIPVKNTYSSDGKGQTGALWHPFSSLPGQETCCFMAPVAYVDCDTDGLGCTVAIAIMDAKCLTKEGYAGNHPAGIYLFNLKNTLEKLEIAARVITEIKNPQYVDCSNPAIPYWNRELIIRAVRVHYGTFLGLRVLELAENDARDNKRTRINPRYLLLVVRNDEELGKLLTGVTIAIGRVLPNINPVLLPNKSAVTEGDKTKTLPKKSLKKA